jgi:hypothetical protein
MRINAVTLSSRDIGRMAAFYRQFGWPEAPTSVPEHVVFQCSNGVVLGLFSDTILERRYGKTADAFRGFTLTIHCEDEETVDRAHSEVSGFDDVCDLDAEPTRSGWGDTGSPFATLRGTPGASPSSTAPTSINTAPSSIPD